jgi:hypothetical protein
MGHLCYFKWCRIWHHTLCHIFTIAIVCVKISWNSHLNNSKTLINHYYTNILRSSSTQINSQTFKVHHIQHEDSAFVGQTMTTSPREDPYEDHHGYQNQESHCRTHLSRWCGLAFGAAAPIGPSSRRCRRSNFGHARSQWSWYTFMMYESMAWSQNLAI